MLTDKSVPEHDTFSLVQVKAHVVEFSKPDLYLAVRALVVTAVLYICSFFAYPLAKKHWALWAAAVFFRAAVNIRFFVIFHDCCHGNAVDSVCLHRESLEAVSSRVLKNLALVHKGCLLGAF